MTRAAIILALSIISAAAVSCNNPGTRQASTIASTTASPSPLATIEFVNDNAQVIDGSSKQRLETTLAALRERKKIDFAVVTVPSTGAQSARDYSLVLARERKTIRNDETVIAGLLLLVAVDDRNWHIQITRNLEADLTEEILTNLSAPMRDSFRQKRYGEGIIKYVNALIAKLEQINFSTATAERLSPTPSPSIGRLQPTQRFVATCL